MIVAPKGHKLAKATDSDRACGVHITTNGRPRPCTPPGATEPYTGFTLKQLAYTLSLFTSHAPVADKTKLEGLYKINLSFWTGANNEGTPEPDMNAALQQQLGLKLVERSGTVGVFTLDRVKKPDAN